MIKITEGMGENKKNSPLRDQDWLTAAVPLPRHKGAPAAYFITRGPGEKEAPLTSRLHVGLLMTTLFKVKLLHIARKQ